MKIATTVFTFARPDYLDKTLISLEKCVDREKIDWYFFQDVLTKHPKRKQGYNKVSQKGVELTTKRIKDTTLPIKEFVKNSRNRGINYQLNQAFQLFSDYDLILFFEDDLVVSKFYLRLLIRCAREYPNTVNTFHRANSTSKNTKKKLRTLVKAPAPRYWGFYITREAYKNIKPGWEKRYKPNKRAPYYDVILTQEVRKRTNGKYRPLISRAKNVGMEGVLSTNPRNWKERGLSAQSDRIKYVRDRHLHNFILKG